MNLKLSFSPSPQEWFIVQHTKAVRFLNAFLAMLHFSFNLDVHVLQIQAQCVPLHAKTLFFRVFR